MAYHHGNLREALLERAAQVIAEKGVEAVSFRSLARDLGVSHAAPARHFADRNALIGELAKDGFLRSAAAMQAGADAAGDDPVARYRALGRSYVRFARENPSYFRAISHPAVRALGEAELREAQRAWFTMLREGAADARASGWHPDVDLESLVAFSISAAMGAATLFADETFCDLLGIEDADALADSVLDLVVHRSRTTALPSAREDEPGQQQERKIS